MSIGIKELLRQPGRFATVGGALTLLVVLLVVLGGFLDGLELNQTGPYRAHEGQVLVFSEESENLIQRSRVDSTQAGQLTEDGLVAALGGLNQVPSTASAVGDTGTSGEILDIVFFGYDVATDVLPPPPSRDVVVDKALADRNGIQVGSRLAIGATAESVTVAAIVDDLSVGPPTVWVANERWREIVAASNPAALLPPGFNQALVLVPATGATDVALAANLRQSGVSAATADEAIKALPVVQQQSSTFQGIIGVTFIVTLLVVALFFALITLERVTLYSVLKALGARTRDLVAGISAQAVLISVVALILGFTISVIFVALLPANLPVRLVPARLVQTALGVVITALLGSLFSLRRVLRIDPAEAIG